MIDNCNKIEQMAQDLNCNAPRVTLDLIKSRIVKVDYQTVTLCGKPAMFCGIEMDNGFVAIGEPSICVDPANWRDEIGREISYNNTINTLWGLEGYRLASNLSTV